MTHRSSNPMAPAFHDAKPMNTPASDYELYLDRKRRAFVNKALCALALAVVVVLGVSG